MNDRYISARALRPMMAAGIVGILMLVAACASAPLAPDSALDAAKVAISNADNARAGDTSGRADLKVGAAGNLDRLVAFLDQNPDRRVVIEGHTDNVGSDDSNLGLSQRRADSVQSFLMQRGIAPGRIISSGKGEHQPVADNESEGGRQQNRRVEVIIENPTPVAKTT